MWIVLHRTAKEVRIETGRPHCNFGCCTAEQVQLEDNEHQIRQLELRVNLQTNDIVQLRSDCRTAHESFNRQVLVHADALKELAAAESKLKSASQGLEKCETALAAAQQEKVLMTLTLGVTT